MYRVLKFHYITVWAKISKILKKHVTYKEFKGIIKENGVSKKKRTKIDFYSRLLQKKFVISSQLKSNFRHHQVGTEQNYNSKFFCFTRPFWAIHQIPKFKR
jgi:hypothetical protein